MAEGPSETGGRSGNRMTAEWAAARAFDPERYLSALLVPEPGRSALLTLVSFAAEIDRIPDLVSEPQLGRIRLQWWRDVIAAPRGDRIGHPLADATRAVIRDHALAPGLAIGLIDAAEFVLDGTPMPDAQHLKAYLIKTEGALFALGARVLGAPEGSVLEQASESAAAAVGGARRVLRFAADLARGRLLVPGLDSEAVRLAAADMSNEKGAAGLRQGLEQLGAESLLACARVGGMVGELPRAARPALLAVAVVPDQLAAWRRARIQPARESIALSPLRRIWRIWRMHRRWQRI